MNATLNGTAELFTIEKLADVSYLQSQFFPLVAQQFMDLLYAPITYLDRGILWPILPLALTLFLMEFYFGRYSDEELGWNSAVGNSLVLIFVSVELFRYLHGDKQPTAIVEEVVRFSSLKTIVASFIAFEGILIFFLNFFHLLPKRLSYRISSSLPINFTAYLGIVLIYGDFLLGTTEELYALVFASIGFFIGLGILFAIIHILEPHVHDLKPPRKEEPPQQKTAEDAHEALYSNSPSLRQY